jgi:SRSO17 transposase
MSWIVFSVGMVVAIAEGISQIFRPGHRAAQRTTLKIDLREEGWASPCVARQYSGTLGKIGNCQAGVSVHLVNEQASCAADWRLFCPESWDDQALADPVAAAGARRRRELARIPGQVRHTEKWRLALEMIEEMTGPGGWGVLEQVTAAGGGRPVVVSDIGYGDNALFRRGLTAAGWQYVVAVKGSPRAHPAGSLAPE